MRRAGIVGATDRPLAARLPAIPAACRKTATTIAGRAARGAGERYKRLSSDCGVAERPPRSERAGCKRAAANIRPTPRRR